MKSKNYLIIMFFIIISLIIITDIASAEWFGSKTGIFTSSTSFENRIVCGRFKMNDSYGYPNNISAYVSIPSAGGGINKTISFSIYDSSGSLVARTYQKNFTTYLGRQWKKLNVNWTKNSTCLIKNNYYNITIWGISSIGNGLIYWDNSVGNGVFNKVNTGQFNFPNPISVLSTNDSSANLDIYCNYTIVFPYSNNIISNVFPTENTTYNVSRVTCHSNFSFVQNNSRGYALRTLVWVDMIPVHSISKYLGNYNATVKFQLDTRYNYYSFAFNEKHNLTINVSCIEFSNYTNNTYQFSYIRYPLSICDNTSITIHNNTIDVTGKYESEYSNLLGWDIWLNYTGNKTNLYLFENIFNATGFHNYTINSTGYTVFANYTGNYSNVSMDCNSSDLWLYLGAMLTFDTGQFFLLILIGLWSYFIYLYYREKEVIFTFCIICCGLPLGIIISGVAYYNSYPFGYLISFILILISFLIPTYGMYQKNKKKK